MPPDPQARGLVAPLDSWNLALSRPPHRLSSVDPRGADGRATTATFRRGAYRKCGGTFGLDDPDPTARNSPSPRGARDLRQDYLETSTSDHELAHGPRGQADAVCDPR